MLGIKWHKLIGERVMYGDSSRMCRSASELKQPTAARLAQTPGGQHGGLLVTLTQALFCLYMVIGLSITLVPMATRTTSS